MATARFSTNGARAAVVRGRGGDDHFRRGERPRARRAARGRARSCPSRRPSPPTPWFATMAAPRRRCASPAPTARSRGTIASDAWDMLFATFRPTRSAEIDVVAAVAEAHQRLALLPGRRGSGDGAPGCRPGPPLRGSPGRLPTRFTGAWPGCVRSSQMPESPSFYPRKPSCASSPSWPGRRSPPDSPSPRR